MALLIRPSDNFNKKNSSLLQKKLQKILANKAEHCCVVDFASLNYINNYGLMTLFALRRIARKNDCNVYLINLNDSVKYCLEVTGLDQTFEVNQNWMSTKT